MGTAEKKPVGTGPAKPEASANHGHGKVEAPPARKRPGGEPLPDACLSFGCKTKSQRFSFCPEHYEQFKFGLIKKTGEPVPDYEKKFEHYRMYRERQAGVRKAA